MSGRTKLKTDQKPKAKYFKPVVGQVYRTRLGCEYRCIECFEAVYLGYGAYNAKMVDEKDGWTFIAHGVKQYKDGMVEWSRATDGYWNA